MQANEEDPGDADSSFRSRVWTSALNKQADFDRQSIDQNLAFRNKSEAHLARKRPYKLDLPEGGRRSADEIVPVQTRARTSLDVEGDSFVLLPGTDAQAKQENSGPRSKQSIAKRLHRVYSHHHNSSFAAAQTLHDDLQPLNLQTDHEKSLSIRITDVLYGRRERPVGAVVFSRTQSEHKRLHRSSRRGRKGPELEMRPDEIDSGALTRADSILSRARRAFSTGTTRPEMIERAGGNELVERQSARSRSGRARSSDGDSFSTGMFGNGEDLLGTEFERDNFESDRATSSRHANSLPPEQLPPEHRDWTVAYSSQEPRQQQEGRSLRRSYIDWDPIRRVGRRSAAKSRLPEVEHKLEPSRSDTSVTRALQKRVRELEDELAVATTESRQMASLLGDLRRETAATKNTVPILEDVIRKSRHHFESKERALRLTIAAMAADFDNAVKTRNDALRALSNHTGRPVYLGSSQDPPSSGGAARQRGSGSSGRRTSSWESLEGSTAARRLRELEELSGPNSASKRSTPAPGGDVGRGDINPRAF